MTNDKKGMQEKVMRNQPKHMNLQRGARQGQWHWNISGLPVQQV